MGERVTIKSSADSSIMWPLAAKGKLTISELTCLQRTATAYTSQWKNLISWIRGATYATNTIFNLLWTCWISCRTVQQHTYWITQQYLLNNTTNGRKYIIMHKIGDSWTVRKFCTSIYVEDEGQHTDEWRCKEVNCFFIVALDAFGLA